MKRTYALTIAMAVLVAVHAGAQDTPPVDARWTPWLGCWQLVQDERGSRTTVGTESEAVRVCVLPDASGRGVGMTTFVGERSVIQQRIVADGASHPVSEPECSGSQRNEWSSTGRRLFTRADITCSGQSAQTVSGIALMADGATWVDIQAVGTDQAQYAQVRVRRYRRTSRLPEGVTLPPNVQAQAAAATPRLAAPTSMTFDEVIEASTTIAAPAVEAALLETDARFDLNSRALRELGAANVPDGVVDVMVALSFPDRFQIDRPLGRRPTQAAGPTVTVEQSNRFPTTYGRDRLRRYSPYYTYDPYYPYDPYNPYYAYGSYDPYYFYYSPFGYSNWWGTRYDPYYSPYSRGPRSVVIVPEGPARPSGGSRSRVVEGRGYTQGGASRVPNAPRTDRGEADRSSRGGESSGASSRRAVSREGYSSGRSSSGARPSGGGGSTRGSGASSGGSGSGGSGAGRTAQPR